VQRHGGFVLGAALRRVGEQGLAEEIYLVSLFSLVSWLKLMGGTPKPRGNAHTIARDLPHSAASLTARAEACRTRQRRSRRALRPAALGSIAHGAR
jgi:hypothetical protein